MVHKDPTLLPPRRRNTKTYSLPYKHRTPPKLHKGSNVENRPSKIIHHLHHEEASDQSAKHLQAAATSTTKAFILLRGRQSVIRVMHNSCMLVCL